jgi:hypothetical protein
MKFKVRAPFAVHHEKIITTEQAGAQVKQPVVESHFAGEVFEMEAKNAVKHLHKLEPADADAQKLFDDKYRANADIQAARGVPVAGPTNADVQAMIKSAVADTLAAERTAQSSGKRGSATA